ncbi:MAG: hypothetical protein ACK533_18795, partial [Planctomycetota bacterium]
MNIDDNNQATAATAIPCRSAPDDVACADAGPYCGTAMGDNQAEYYRGVEVGTAALAAARRAGS